jgi:putative nucleotidyltransferase with HDIG domain
MMSATTRREMVIQAVRAGAYDFLVKPPPLEIVPDRLGTAYERGSRERNKESSKLASMSVGERIDFHVERATTIKALPQAVAKILQMAASDDSAADDLAKAVESDPSIAAMILKRARSSFYSRGKPVTELQQAVIRLGFKECKELVISLSVFQLFKGEEKTFGFSRLGFWLHSIVTALLTKQICKQVRIESGESALTAGLLHDIGKVILDDFLSDDFMGAVRKAGMERMPLLDAERATFERDHTTVGRKVVDKWRFPESLGNVISNHHRHEDLLYQECVQPSLTGAVALANQMAKALTIGEAGDFFVEDITPGVWLAYGFQGRPMTGMLSAFYEELAEFCTFLGISEAELGGSIEHAPDRGTAVLVDPEEKNTALLTLFLANKGYHVEHLDRVSEAIGLAEPPNLILYRANDVDSARTLVSQVAPNRHDQTTMICTVPGLKSNLDIEEVQPWLRMIADPIDCFELGSAVRSLARAQAKAPEPVSSTAPSRA